MKSILALTVVTIGWNFEFCVNDILQYKPDLNSTNWVDVSGPYHLNEDGSEYRVKITNDAPVLFFRVKRDWGTPLVPVEEWPATNANNTINCH